MMRQSSIVNRQSADRGVRSLATGAALRHRARSSTVISTHTRRQPTADSRQPNAGRGFTLVELLIAIVVLLAVILALGRIFSTVTEVTSIGQASATIMQEAAVIEQRLREDIANLSTDGIFAIRQVAVRNDVHGDNVPLLDPSRPRDAYIRSDQLLFFTDHISSFQTSRHGEAGNLFAQANAARVYWGHAVQLPDGPAFEPASQPGRGFALDPGNEQSQEPFVPWRRGELNMVRTLVSNVENEGPLNINIYERNVGPVIDGTQPPPSRWLLARQSVLLADSTPPSDPPNVNRKTRFGAEGPTSSFSAPMARSIFLETPYGINEGTPHPRYGYSREIRNGRVDGAATTLSEIRHWLRTNPEASFGANVIRPWTDFDNAVPLNQGGDQRTIIGREILYYPRGERRAPSMFRTDQALTNHIIGSAVSDFIVEWTWDDGTGDIYDAHGRKLVVDGNDNVVPESEAVGNFVPFGFYTNWFSPDLSLYEYQPEQPWFGMNLPNRGVGFYGDVPFDDTPESYQVRANYKPAETVFPNANLSGFYNNVNYDPTSLDVSTIERWWTATQFANWYGLQQWDVYGNRVWIYEAFFGYNDDTPHTDTPQGSENLTPDMIFPALGYTPWPSAIRVTMTLHDPQGKLESGREVQFVIELPKRER